jgi:hypothetical protein
MPKFTETHGTTVVTKLQLPTGGKKRLHFHEEQKAQDRTDRPTMTSSDAKVIGSVLTALYDGPKGIWTVDLTAAKDGTATVTGKRKDGQAAEIGVSVAAPPPQMKLPAENTPEGLVTRLLLSETQTPSNLTYNDADAQKAMEWMHLVLYNRLKDSMRFGAKKNAGIVDLIKAKDQFAGFENYPKIAAGLQARVAEILKKANNIGGIGQGPENHLFMRLRAAGVLAAGDSRGLTGHRGLEQCQRLHPLWQGRLTLTDLRALTPLKWQHVNSYVTFALNMNERLPPAQAA